VFSSTLVKVFLIASVRLWSMQTALLPSAQHAAEVNSTGNMPRKLAEAVGNILLYNRENTAIY